MNATVSIKTKDGTVPCHFFPPPQKEPRPAVILYMDAIGIRPALADMAQRLASHGYYVLLPDLYYRAGSLPHNPDTAFKEGPDRDRRMALMRSINNKLIMEDTAAFLDFFDRQPGVKPPKVGCVGYCMGGAFALSAAGTFPDRIAAAASLHGARLATEAPDSPHLLAPKMKAALYIGIAGLDPHFTPEEKQRLESALTTAHVKHTTEIYPNAKHGFAVTDHPVYDRPAAEQHWQRLLSLFTENLSAK
jgi:carboxymethylenebutenolidase